MESNVEYRIFIGLSRPRKEGEAVSGEELKKTINADTILVTKTENEYGFTQ